MKNFILPFLLLLLFNISCENQDELLESKVASYDVYVAGTENLQVAYWKNNQKTILPGGDNLNGVQIEVDNNDVYVLAVNIESIDQVPAWYFWKNGVKNNVAQYLNVTENTTTVKDNLSLSRKMIVSNGNVYFAGTMKNPNPTSSADQFQICYWKNGIKTVVSSTSSEYVGGFEIFNNDIYMVTRKNFNPLNMTWDLTHYKNGAVFSAVANTSVAPEDYYKNLSDLFLLEKSFSSPPNNYSYTQSYKNVQTSANFNMPANINTAAIKYIYWNDTDQYYVGNTFYYKNSTLVQINDPTGFNQIGHLFVNDQNIYMTRIHNNMVKFYINNVETMMINDITKGCLNDIFVVQN
ncbi:hypothetical protein [Chryseobacterium sp. Leaf180]|uniref:hypothetical protein n=1 Tax=Chryseobacterium sp. Leaf180 TaxID=1736289 RepID=UPI000A96E821|nr:hypothetical protein [Chryseobacterium sp. Leaf180]